MQKFKVRSKENFLFLFLVKADNIFAHICTVKLKLDTNYKYWQFSRLTFISSYNVNLQCCMLHAKRQGRQI